MATTQTGIELRDVLVRRLHPDDPRSKFGLEIVLTDQGSGEHCLFEWEAQVEDPENTPVKTIESDVYWAVERIADEPFTLPDDRYVLEMYVQRSLAHRGIEVSS